MNERPSTERGAWLTLPNAITVVRFLLVVPIGVLIISDRAPIWTIVLVAIFCASDWVDGFLARKLGQISSVGEWLDPLADRIGVVALAVFLVIGEFLPLWIAALIVCTDLILGFVYVFSRSVPIQATTMLGKFRTAMVMVGLLLIVVGRVPESDVVLLIGVIITGIGAVLHVFVGVGYGRAILRARRSQRPGSDAAER